MTAVESVKGAVNGVKQVGGDTLGATKTAIIAALEAAKEIGGGATDAVKSSLAESVDGAKKSWTKSKKVKFRSFLIVTWSTWVYCPG
jgi:hypothetical protein